MEQKSQRSRMIIRWKSRHWRWRGVSRLEMYRVGGVTTDTGKVAMWGRALTSSWKPKEKRWENIMMELCMGYWASIRITEGIFDSKWRNRSQWLCPKRPEVAALMSETGLTNQETMTCSMRNFLRQSLSIHWQKVGSAWKTSLLNFWRKSKRKQTSTFPRLWATWQTMHTAMNNKVA